VPDDVQRDERGKREVPARVRTEPDDEPGMAPRDVPAGSRLWQLLATRWPAALHAHPEA
jgi:hypothetical protein